MWQTLWATRLLRVILACCSLCQIYPELRSAYMKDGLFPEMIELPHLIKRNRPP